MGIQLVIFELNNEEYGIEITSVTGILRARKFKVQTLPGSDKSIEGIINLRGSVNYIFNLRTKFNFEEKEISDESKFIMLNSHNSTIGFVVDEVTDIVKLNDEMVQPAPNFTGGINTNYIIGIGTLEDRMIIILDPEEIFAKELGGAVNYKYSNDTALT